ncbi:MAG: PAS domain S-box protein [Bacteroidetes bacterium]|nr:PAS domain S-box protein [Bacteroidota bacterium]
MKENFTRKLFKVLLIRDAEKVLHPDDLTSRQRLNLFRTFSLTGFLITLAISYEVLSFFNAFDFIGVSLSSLTVVIAINYFSLNFHKNFRVAYAIIIFSCFLFVHFVTYYSGGIRNSGMMYMGGLILVTFMLLGNREGKIVSTLSVLNLIFFYFYSSEFGKFTKNIVDTDAEGKMLNFDYLITYSTATILLYSLSNNLESSKNIVIAKVTESKEALERKNEELKKLSLVASKADNSVVITDAENRIEWVNDGFTRLTGFHISEVEGRRMVDLLSGPENDEQVLELIRNSVSQKHSFSGEVKRQHKDGRSIWLQETITPIADDRGEITQFVHVESDITERKEAEEKMQAYYTYLEKANKELDKFAYVVSHDLKAPLRAISNLTTWIEEDMGDKMSEDSRQHFNMVKGRVVRMEALINGILDYSRADRVKAPNAPVDVDALVHEVIELLVQDDKIKISIPDKMPVLKTEKLKLQQVFSNLVSNAIKHNDKPDAEIKITCEEEKEFYKFCVEDNGPGIDERYHEKIFVIFQTLQARDTFESTGVGLAIVKKIVDEIGGSIWIESEVGKFTRFVFRWPKESSESFKPFQFTLEQNSGDNVQKAENAKAS